jgi:hypothetical protein
MYTCPCCGHEVFDEEPGSYSICPICFWEDDAMQLYYPDQTGGANPSSLIQSQVNFFQFGACDRAMVKNVRSPTSAERRDPLWFPLWDRKIQLPDEDDRTFHNESSIKKLCYWLRCI